MWPRVQSPAKVDAEEDERMKQQGPRVLQTSLSRCRDREHKADADCESICQRSEITIFNLRFK